MTPPSTLLDLSFLQVLVDPRHASHEAALATYRELVDAYERHEMRLRARHDHLDALGGPVRQTVLAPVERISVAAQYRRAARRVRLPDEIAARITSEAERTDVAITLVVLRRERIDSVVSHLAALSGLTGLV